MLSVLLTTSQLCTCKASAPAGMHQMLASLEGLQHPASTRIVPYMLEYSHESAPYKLIIVCALLLAVLKNLRQAEGMMQSILLRF